MKPHIPELKQNLFLFFYQGVLTLAGAVYLVLRLARRRPAPGLMERLGWYRRPLRGRMASLRCPLWIHMVSVGEVLAARPLVEKLRRRFPDRSILFTTVTPTGREMARPLVRDGKDLLLYLPWDFQPIVRRAIRKIRPWAFLVFETELWPVLFHELNRAQVPILLVNGRLSPAAYRRYLWIRPFVRMTLAPVRAFLVQSAQDARRYAALGAAKDRIAVTGNLKWDLNLDEKPASAGGEDLRALLRLSPTGLLWIAASTHPGEERIVLAVYRNLKANHPDLHLLVAPRHPERIPEVEQEVNRAGFQSVRRTSLGEGSRVKGESTVILLDTLGELARFYAACDLVFMGGSLVPHGGHNLVEPALFSRAILTGPHFQNFQAMAEALQQAGGMGIVRSAQELEERMRQLLGEPTLRRQLGQRAFAVIREHRGATDRTVALILRVMAQEKDRPQDLDAVFGFLKNGLLAVAASGYRAGVWVIRRFYAQGTLPVHRLPAPVVSVGNLTWGGTGKTPLVIHLAKGLRTQGRRPAVLTRGYGKDEARLLSQRLDPIPVLVGADRLATGTRAVRERGADLLILDDGYQQWRLKKDVEILTVDASLPFGNGHLLPRGSLREPVSAASRADLIVVTKADLNPDGLKDLETQLRRWNEKAPLFFARYRPVGLTRWPGGEKLSMKELAGQRVCTLAGLARPESFEATVRAAGAQVALKIRFRDHHPYTTGELLRLLDRCRRHRIDRIVTTAKDAVRIPKLLAVAAGPDLRGITLMVLEVELEFEPDESQLLHRIDTLLAR